jgi:hypothetical protein
VLEAGAAIAVPAAAAIIAAEEILRVRTICRVVNFVAAGKISAAVAELTFFAIRAVKAVCASDNEKAVQAVFAALPPKTEIAAMELVRAVNIVGIFAVSAIERRQYDLVE